MPALSLSSDPVAGVLHNLLPSKTHLKEVKKGEKREKREKERMGKESKETNKCDLLINNHIKYQLLTVVVGRTSYKYCPKFTGKIATATLTIAEQINIKPH